LNETKMYRLDKWKSARNDSAFKALKMNIYG
jgi:hypothetical protein